MHTPPLPGSRASTSSGTLRGWSHSTRADECEKITGASAAVSASRMVDAATWDRSTSMPSRCISPVTARPNPVRPPAAGSSVAESAHGTFRLWVRVMYRTPSAYSARSTPSEQSIECPPSAPSSEAIRPAAIAPATSAAVLAGASASG